MHADEVNIDVRRVARLVAGQFPRWADLPVEPVEPAGTDNAIFRLGTDLAVRLPRIGWASDAPAQEYRRLPRLARHLPLAIPVPLALGTPAEGHPYPWTVCRWLTGEPAMTDRIADPVQAAIDLAGFIAALQRIDPTDGRDPAGAVDRSHPETSGSAIRSHPSPMRSRSMS